MPPWLIMLARRYGLRLAIAGGAWLYRKGRETLDENLPDPERRELRALLAKSKGRKKNLTVRERQRVMGLARKAVGLT